MSFGVFLPNFMIIGSRKFIQNDFLFQTYSKFIFQTMKVYNNKFFQKICEIFYCANYKEKNFVKTLMLYKLILTS